MTGGTCNAFGGHEVGRSVGRSVYSVLVTPVPASDHTAVSPPPTRQDEYTYLAQICHKLNISIYDVLTAIAVQF